ncbi:Eco57I restriction-modification methylase domain-containing protein [Geminocystis sp. NIES-3709]|uniref:type IIG restriction enzyme/methyltransferase n=1 Tax=Geminocystis sp. NIES-3709 TaxID=1617448 RepID=UPI0005FC5DF0|nr:Eco57I restriction-modification methylase domain-containing protein [Geminocystis sp. NIES-3709]BAQ64609.1 putative type IIS restriction/modification enzyme [Geminocystis sp. NIES-3709]
MGILAKRNEERNPDIKAKFNDIPYLNSSLFEITELENQTLFIANLNNDYQLPLFTKTVLKDNQGRRKTGELNTLTYLFDFLSAYNFSSEGKEEIQAERKNLINASVLGLIFEKINGYQDGSYFTPGFITMYMCRETITRAVIEKFNQEKNWNGTNIENLQELIEYQDQEVRKEANNIINSIKICDPAVGSGHFLVSGLNEIIALKSKLNILQDREGKRIKEYTIEVENDELVIKDEDGDLYSYKPNYAPSQRIQETLFYEKKTIIENCLFGVDINLNSVNICRLRLWIELLKNAYYHRDTKELETLPNIDINIKCGNSLISRFDLNSDLSLALKKINLTIADYQQAIKTYHNPQNRQEKEEIVKLIKQIKDNFNTLMTGNTPLEKKLREKESQLYQLQNQTSLLPESDDDKKARETTEKSLNNEINQLKKEIEDETNNVIYRNAFEWRFEFPEVLNEKGDFIGFDLIIGNPPYISANSGEEILKLRQKILQSNRYKTLWEKWDLYVAFIEESFQLIKNRGLCSLIIPYPYLNQNYAKLSREFIIKENTLLEIVNLHSIKVFETATVNNCIVFGKKEYKGDYKIKVSLPEDYKINKTFYVDKYNILTTNSVIELETRKTFNFSQKQFKNLGDVCFISVGMVLNADEKRVKGAFKKKDLISDTQSGIHQKQYIEAKNIDSYQINLIRFLEWNTNRVPNLIRRPTFPELYQNEKILINKIGKIKATYDNNNLFCDQTIRIAVLWCNLIGVQNKSIDNNVKKFSNYSRQQLEQFSTQINIKFILGILNSKLGNYLLDNIRGVGNIDLNPDYLKNIPIPYVPLEQQKTIINLVDEILEIKKKKPQTKTNNKEEIDELVYKLYGLTKEEIKIIEGHQ